MSKYNISFRKKIIYHIVNNFTKTASKIIPTAGNFARDFLSLQGQDREDFVYDYVASGLMQNFDLVSINMNDPTNPKTSLVVETFPQYFTIEGFPVQVNPITAEKITRLLSQKIGKRFSLPTQEITKAIWSNSKIIPGMPRMDRLGTESNKLLEYSKDVLDARKNKKINPNDLIAGEYKELELPHDGKNLHASGLSDNSGNMIQSFKGSTMHDTRYVDYSHAFRPVTITLPTGENLSPLELIEKAKADNKYQLYANIISSNKPYKSYIDKPEDSNNTLPSSGLSSPDPKLKEFIDKYDISNIDKSTSISDKSSNQQKTNIPGKLQSMIGDIGSFLSSFKSLGSKN